MKKRFLILFLLLLIILALVMFICIQKDNDQPIIIKNNSNSFIEKEIKIETGSNIEIDKFIINLKYNYKNPKLKRNINFLNDNDWKLEITDRFGNKIETTTIYLNENNLLISKEDAYINGVLKNGIKKKEIISKTGKYKVQIKNNGKNFNSILIIEDKEKPNLILKEIKIKEKEEVNINSFIESCTDNSYNECINLKLINYESLPTEAGEYELEFTIEDINRNVSDSVKTKFIIEKEEEEVIYYEQPNVSYSESTSYSYDRSNPIVDKALSLVGSTGLCTQIAESAINTIGKTAWLDEIKYGFTFSSLTPENFIKIGREVSISEVIPGDILYYDNGGTGSSHVAIYIGNGNAVHGNFNGITTIYSMYVPGASNPRPIRIN